MARGRRPQKQDPHSLERLSVGLTTQPCKSPNYEYSQWPRKKPIGYNDDGNLPYLKAMEIINWKRKAQDRGEGRGIVREAKAPAAL